MVLFPPSFSWFSQSFPSSLYIMPDEDASLDGASGNSSQSQLPTWKCIQCKGDPKPLTEFPFKKGVQPGLDAPRITTCRRCDTKKRALRKEREAKKDKETNKENESPQNVSSSDEETSADPQLSLLGLTDFLSVIGDQHTSLKLEANVDLGTLLGGSLL